MLENNLSDNQLLNIGVSYLIGGFYIVYIEKIHSRLISLITHMQKKVITRLTDFLYDSYNGPENNFFSSIITSLSLLN